MSDLLWAAQGVTSDEGGRTAPSAGALYPLEVYVVTEDAVLHYLPDGHRAESRESATVRLAVADAVGQDAARAAPAVIVIAGVPARVEPKYGGPRRAVPPARGRACRTEPAARRHGPGPGRGADRRVR